MTARLMNSVRKLLKPEPSSGAPHQRSNAGQERTASATISPSNEVGNIHPTSDNSRRNLSPRLRVVAPCCSSVANPSPLIGVLDVKPEGRLSQIAVDPGVQDLNVGSQLIVSPLGWEEGLN